MIVLIVSKSKDRLLSVERSYTVRRMMEYFQLKDRILSAMIEHFTYDSTSALEVPYPCIIELTFYFRIQPFYHHDLVHMDYVFHK